MSLVFSATPFLTSSGVVTDWGVVASRSCFETASGVATGLASSSFGLLTSDKTFSSFGSLTSGITSSSFGFTTSSLGARLDLSEELVSSTTSFVVGVVWFAGRAESTASFRTVSGNSFFSTDDESTWRTGAGVEVRTSACTVFGCPTSKKKPLATTTEATPTLKRRIDQRVYFWFGLNFIGFSFGLFFIDSSIIP